MPRKPLTREQKVRKQQKPLGITLAELKAEIDQADGDLRRTIIMKREFGTLRPMVRCKKTIPQSWGMSLILDNAMIDCVHFHRTDYTNTEGNQDYGMAPGFDGGGSQCWPQDPGEFLLYSGPRNSDQAIS
jgi:hypothetical protein